MQKSGKMNFFGSLLLAIFLGGCVVPAGSHRPPPPPPHFYHYWYYPYSGIYYDIDRRVYFYFINGVWIQRVILPPHFRLQPAHRVKIRTKLPKPYKQHHEHVKKYPAPHPPAKKERQPVIRDKDKRHPPPPEEETSREEKSKKDKKKSGGRHQ